MLKGLPWIRDASQEPGHEITFDPCVHRDLGGVHFAHFGRLRVTESVIVLPCNRAMSAAAAVLRWLRQLRLQVYYLKGAATTATFPVGNRSTLAARGFCAHATSSDTLSNAAIAEPKPAHALPHAHSTFTAPGATALSRRADGVIGGTFLNGLPHAGETLMKHALTSVFITLFTTLPSFASAAFARPHVDDYVPGHLGPPAAIVRHLGTASSAPRDIQLAYQLPRTSAPMGMHMSTGSLQPMNGTVNHMSMSFSRTQTTYRPQNDNGAPKSKPVQQQKRKNSVEGYGGGSKVVRLKIDGVAGESADDKHKSEIHINRHSRRRGNTSLTEHVQLNYNSVRH